MRMAYGYMGQHAVAVPAVDERLIRPPGRDSDQ